MFLFKPIRVFFVFTTVFCSGIAHTSNATFVDSLILTNDLSFFIKCPEEITKYEYSYGDHAWHRIEDADSTEYCNSIFCYSIPLSQIDFGPDISLEGKSIKTLDNVYRYSFTKNYLTHIREESPNRLYTYTKQSVEGLHFFQINSFDRYELIFMLKDKRCLMCGDGKFKLELSDTSFTEKIYVEEHGIIALNHSYKENETLFIQNGKIGFERGDSLIIQPDFDYLSLSDHIILALNDSVMAFYNFKGELLIRDPKDCYWYSGTYVQVVDQDNKMYFLDKDKNKSDKPRTKRVLRGIHSTRPDYWKYRIFNLTGSASNEIVDAYHINIPEKTDENLSDYDLKEIYWKKHFNEDELTEKEANLESYYMPIELSVVLDDVVFMNGENELHYRTGEYEQSTYSRLSYSYMIGKKEGKYGVYCFEGDSVVLPFEYKKMVTMDYSNYLYFKKGRFYGLYPQTNSEACFKKLTPFVENYARFKDKEGRKGWINRKGQRFYDNEKKSSR